MLSASRQSIRIRSAFSKLRMKPKEAQDTEMIFFDTFRSNANKLDSIS